MTGFHLSRKKLITLRSLRPQSYQKRSKLHTVELQHLFLPTQLLLMAATIIIPSTLMFRTTSLHTNPSLPQTVPQDLIPSLKENIPSRSRSKFSTILSCPHNAILHRPLESLQPATAPHQSVLLSKGLARKTHTFRAALLGLWRLRVSLSWVQVRRARATLEESCSRRTCRIAVSSLCRRSTSSCSSRVRCSLHD